MARTDGGTAFPCPSSRQTDGMSLRDYFAIHADLGGYEFRTVDPAERVLGQAVLRYQMADAMLAARQMSLPPLEVAKPLEAATHDALFSKMRQ